jgi:ribA/ribD-fused uncharacterized protein
MYPLKYFIETPLGVWVPTSEHAYQAAKFVDEDAARSVLTSSDGKASKTKAHELQEAGASMVTGWHQRKFEIMLGFVRDKFYRNDDIAEQLVSTGDELLVEGNTWGDRYWGVDPIGSSNGKNRLGQVLMQVRTELAESE